MSRPRDDAGPRRDRGEGGADGQPAERDAGRVPVSRTQSVVLTGEDDDAGTDVGASDPAPGVDQPGRHGCEGGPESDALEFEQDLGDANSTVLRGTVSHVDGDGRFYVESGSGQSIGGAVHADRATGTYEVEVPLFCGTQTVKLVWANRECDLVIVYRIRTDACETDLRVTVAWDALGRDWELHLVREGGRINDGVNDCTWTSCIGRTLDWGVIGDPADDPKKDVDNVGAYGPENIVLERAPRGSYVVMVEHWGAGSPASDGEITINLAGAAPRVIRVFNLHPQHVFTAAAIDWPGGDLRVIGLFHDCASDWAGGCQDPIP